MFAVSATGGMIYKWVTGYLFEYHGTDTLMYVILGFSCMVALLFLCMQLVTCNFTPRFMENNGEVHDMETKDDDVEQEELNEKCAFNKMQN